MTETIKNVSQSSIDITKNSRGYTFEVKLYEDVKEEELSRLKILAIKTIKEINTEIGETE